MIERAARVEAAWIPQPRADRRVGGQERDRVRFACVRCKKPMREPYVVTSTGPVGPKCAAALGMHRQALKKDGTARAKTMRMFSAPRAKADPNQLDLLAELEAATA